LNDGSLQGGINFFSQNYTGLALHAEGYDGLVSSVDTGYGSGYAINNSGEANFVLAAPANPAAVPEPSQVAASILLIGGIAGFVIVRRRKAQVA
jgi:hypothetical protein